MEDLVYRLRKRAEIRRSISTRKSVIEGQPDRISDILEEAADALEKLQAPNPGKSPEFDVVIHALEDHRAKLWKMTNQNEYTGWGIMDSIRLEQMDRLDCAIACWKKYKGEWVDE